MATRQFLALEVPIDEIVPSAMNVRQDVGDVSELADSIREQGILEPLVVRPREDGTYEAIIGSRRLAASKVVGLSSLPVLVQDIPDADAIVRSLVENLQRGDLSLEDRVEAYKKLQQMDTDRFSTRGLARLIGKEHSKIVLDLEAHAALVQLRPQGIQVVNNTPPSAQNRQSGEAIPERHASLLQQAMTAVRGQLAEDQADDTRVELARAIAPLEQERARRVLDYFKMYPDRQVSDIVSMALATVQQTITIPAATARRLEEIANETGQGDVSGAITRLVEQGTSTAAFGEEENQDSEDYDAIERQWIEAGGSPGLFDLPEDEGTSPQDVEPSRILPRPLELPEEPASVQAKNKVIWNLTHYAPNPDFYTIGYAGRDIGQFVEIIKAAKVSTVVDVRHAPISQYKPDFNKASLKAKLEAEGIQYSHRGEWGVPHAIRERAVGAGSRESIWKWYDQNVAPTVGTGGVEAFKESGQMVAFMCSEGDPTACHRHRLFLAIEATGFKGFDL